MLVPDRARKCVVFLGIKEGGQFKPRATAFSVEILDQQHRWRYLVTAEHVVSGLLTKGHDIWLRVNNRNTAQDLKIDPSDWWYHPQTADANTDVALIPISFDNEPTYSPFRFGGRDPLRRLVK